MDKFNASTSAAARSTTSKALTLSLLSIAISGLLSGTAMAAPDDNTAPGLDHNPPGQNRTPPGQMRGPRGLVLVPDGNGGQKLDVPDDGVSSAATQPEPDTPLNKDQLQHLEVQGVTALPDGVKLEMGDYTGYVRVLASRNNFV